MKRIHHLRSFGPLLMGFLWAFPTDANAQSLSVQASVGVVTLPLNDWSNFFGNTSNASYTKNNPNLYWALSVYYPLGRDHSIQIGTELIRTSASSSSPAITVNWKFQGIPITLGYEYKVLTFNEHFTPVAGMGISYFISQVDGSDNVFNITSRRNGNGYGVHLSLGLRWEFAQSLGMVSQIRYRYSDGMAFTDKNNDVKVEFTGFDFSTGLSWGF
jgi:outer membrane protein W